MNWWHLAWGGVEFEASVLIRRISQCVTRLSCYKMLLILFERIKIVHNQHISV